MAFGAGGYGMSVWLFSFAGGEGAGGQRRMPRRSLITR
jgi:hypothetical protein